jgi:hypothetical protein
MMKNEKTGESPSNVGIREHPTPHLASSSRRKIHKHSHAKGITTLAEAGPSRDDEAPPYKAHWPRWTCYSVARLDQAVALSCDVDPDALRNPVEFEFGGFAADDPDPDCDPTPDVEFLLWSDRHQIAESQAGVGFGIVDWVPNEMGGKTPRVLMAEFAAWAVALGKISPVWKNLPNELRSLVPNSTELARAPNSTPQDKLAELTTTATLKPAAAERLGKTLAASAPKPTAEEGSAEEGAFAAPKSSAEENSNRHVPADDCNARDKIAPSRDERSMLLLIRALASKIGRRLEHVSADAAKIVQLVTNAGGKLSHNTVRKFLHRAKPVNLVSSPSRGGAADDAPVDPQERESMLTIILALITESERRLQRTLTDVEVGESMDSTELSVLHDLIVQNLREARDLKPAKSPAADTDHPLSPPAPQSGELPNDQVLTPPSKVDSSVR